MEDKEGSGIQKYTESPVTSRSISGKDMTSVYYIFFIALKDFGVYVSYNCTEIRLESQSAGPSRKNIKYLERFGRGRRGKAISRLHWFATSDSILFLIS